MRIRSDLILLTAALALATTSAPAQAEPYKWCAQYSGDGEGGRNCGFVSVEQCMQTVRGMGGTCEPNLFYTGPADQPAKRPRKKTNG